MVMCEILKLLELAKENEYKLENKEAAKTYQQICNKLKELKKRKTMDEGDDIEKIKEADIYSKYANILGKLKSNNKIKAKQKQLYEKAVNSSKTEEERSYYCGMMELWVTKNHEKALLCFENAKHFDEQLASHHLGITFLLLNDFEHAMTSFLHSISLNENYERSHYSLAILYAKNKNYNEAIFHYKKAISINPNYCNAYYNLANLFNQMNQIVLSIPLYKQIIRLNPLFMSAYYNLAISYYQLLEFSSALKVFDRILFIYNQKTANHSHYHHPQISTNFNDDNDNDGDDEEVDDNVDYEGDDNDNDDEEIYRNSLKYYNSSKTNYLKCWTSSWRKLFIQSLLKKMVHSSHSSVRSANHPLNPPLDDHQNILQPHHHHHHHHYHADDDDDGEQSLVIYHHHHDDVGHLLDGDHNEEEDDYDSNPAYEEILLQNIDSLHFNFDDDDDI